MKEIENLKNLNMINMKKKMNLKMKKKKQKIIIINMIEIIVNLILQEEKNKICFK